MNKRPVIWIIFLFFLCTAVSLNAESISKEKKDPILAGALSWYVPGLGQIYSGAYLKGIAFFVVEESLFIGTLLSFFELQLDVTGGIDLGLNIKSKEDPERGEQTVGIVLGVSFIAVHFFNVIDAVNSSRKYNRNIEKDFYTGFHYDTERSGYAVEFNKRL